MSTTTTTTVTFLPLDAPRLGDYARDVHGHVGRIYQIHHSCPEGAAWQSINHITEEEKGERWLSMLVFPAGAVVGPASRFTRTDPVPDFHTQRDACDYFGDCVTEGTIYKDLRESLT